MIDEKIRICLLGGLEVHGPKGRARFPTARSRSVFAYLALSRGCRGGREQMLAVFWPEHDTAAARQRLRTNVWRIGQALAGAGCDPSGILVSDTAFVGLSRAHIASIDVELFEDAVGECRARAEWTDADVGTLERALALYRGHLIEEDYDEWCFFERERLRALYLDALMRLTDFRLARAQWTGALESARRILACDPLQEHVHRAVIRCYSATGNRAAAIAQFEHLKELLAEELDLDPLPETELLAQAVRRGFPAEQAIAGGPPVSPTGYRTAAHRVQSAMRELDRAHEVLLRYAEQAHSD